MSECLHYHLKPVMRSAKSYVRDTSDSLKKLKELGCVPQNELLVTGDLVGLYPSISHLDGLEALSIKLNQRLDKKILADNQLEMAPFVLKNNYIEFDSMIKQQVSGTAIGTTFSPPYACIFMDRVDAEFLEKQYLKLWVWLRYVDDTFFIWTHGEDKLYKFPENLNSFHVKLKFTSKYSRQEINFLDVTVKLNNNQFVADLYCKLTD